MSVGAASALAEGAAEEGRDGVGDGSAENDASVVGVAEVHPARGEGRDGPSALRVLLAGDAEPAGQARALRSAALLDLDLSADVLKLPHHGLGPPEPRFFAASGASLAVASAGADNDYGHPAKAALDLRRRERHGRRAHRHAGHHPRRPRRCGAAHHDEPEGSLPGR